ncbi:MAG: polysaccharide biosynthesis/export family protein [Acidobacteria bacterium]|nr:polysaccharide biosynthesis/export family protein [Acidobacteriota bacterium]
MKMMHSLRAEFAVLAAVLCLAAATHAQDTAVTSKDGTKLSDPVVIAASTPEATPERTPAGAATVKNDPKADAETDPEEVKEVYAYYNNYLKEYRLGPNDVISVEVFGQCPDYCKLNVTVPPTARISYPLIRDGVFVAGKTVEEVAAEITKKLDEYIIDPKVSVTLDKAMSIRYSVMGKVVSPGVRVMDHKISVYEAIIDAGGVAKGGDKSKIVLVSYNAQGRLERRTLNLGDIESGKQEMVFLSPGDQVFVPGKGFSIEKVFDYLGKASAVRLLFGSPF